MSAATPTPDAGKTLRLPTHLELPCAGQAGGPGVWAAVTHKDLPATDGKPVENAFQPLQSHLLTDILGPVLAELHPDGQFFVGEDVGIYWRLTPPDPMQGCKAPDWFYVPGVTPLLEGEVRCSYVLWNEPVSPVVVVEFVSGDGAEEHDRTAYSGRFWVYENAIHAAHYLIYDPARRQLEGFGLSHGRYVRIPPTERGRIPVEPLGVEFGVWRGTVLNVETDWLRAWDAAGRLLPTGTERAERLAARLRELGVDPDAI